MSSRTRTIPIPEFKTQLEGWRVLRDLYEEHHLWFKAPCIPAEMADRILTIKKYYLKLKFSIAVVDEQFVFLNWEPDANPYDIGEL